MPEQRQLAFRFMDDHETIEALGNGPLFWFCEWPTGDVPRTGSLVYTVWDRDGSFVYVGMSGRTSLQAGTGPWGRLNSHASGRRSGDQFCVYVCDRLVIPSLHNRLEDLRAGALSLDQETRAYIRERLGFRWIAVAGPAEAFAMERTIQRGLLPTGKPFLNPL
jgi:hypothetical protein